MTSQTRPISTTGIDRESLRFSRENDLIPHSRPQLQRDDFDYIDGISQTQQVAGGQLVGQLEKAVGTYLNVRHAVAVSHGTAALHLALLGLGVENGDEVIIPSYTCAALLHAANYVGAKPVLVDINPETFNPDPDMVKSCITPKTKAILLTHTFGFPADVKGIQELGVPVIEDCSYALGASYLRKPAGSWGRISTFSFYATKMICSGEGGMVCTDDRRLAKRLRELTSPESFGKEYEVRYNYKMSDLTAGLALSQFHRLPDFVKTRRELAAKYKEAIYGSKLGLQQPVAGAAPCHYRFVLKTRRPAAVIRLAAERGIGCDRPVFRPLHHYQDQINKLAFKNTDSVWRSGVSVPLYPDLSEQELSSILDLLTEISRGNE